MNDTCLVEGCKTPISSHPENIPHEHVWQPVGIVKEMQREVRYLGTTLASTRENSIAVQSCTCGEIKRTVVAYGEWDY